MTSPLSLQQFVRHTVPVGSFAEFIFVWYAVVGLPPLLTASVYSDCQFLRHGV